MTTIALVLAAGEGTRMKSKTPKVLHTVLGTPMISMVLNSAKAAGCDHSVVITGHEAEKVSAVLSDDVHTVFQPTRAGTANAVYVAKEKIEELLGHSLEASETTDPKNGVLVVLSGDTPCLTPETIKKLVDRTLESGAAATILTAEAENPCGYGRILRCDEHHINGVVEERDASPEQKLITEVNTGTYCFALDNLFDRLLRINNNNAQNELYLPDIIPVLLEDGMRVESISIEDAGEAAGVNTRVQLAEAVERTRQTINKKHMLNGVTIEVPSLTWISPEVTIEEDVVILSNCRITGKTSIASGALIGPDTRIENSQIGEKSCVDSSIVLDSKIEEGASIGPRAYLRPGCEIGRGAKVGTSVELKASKIGEGSKVPHLSYIGDAVIGTNVNVGAGTITCNYDGVNKSKTIIGDNVFVGSDVMLIAPVTIGDGAVIGASSAISKDVPANSLAVERSEQVIKENWTRKNQEGTNSCKS